MTISIGFGLAVIAFLMTSLIMGGVYFALGRWVSGRPRAFIAAAITGAYFVGRFQQAYEEAGQGVLSDPRVWVIVATFAATLTLLALRTDRNSALNNIE